MRKIPLVLALCAFIRATPLHASFDYLPADPEGLGMAGAMTAVAGDAFGILYNPASPSRAGSSAAGFACTIPYGDADLRTLAGGVNWHRPSFDRNGTFSVAMKHYGSEKWHEQTVSAGYSHELLAGVHAGVSFSNLTQGTGENDDTAMGVNAGLQANLGRGVALGFSSFNLNAPTIGSSDTKLPRLTLAGFSCLLKSGNLLTANVLTASGRSARLLAAGEFNVMKHLVVMTGLGTNPSVISAGGSYSFGPVRAKAAVSRNINLGTTASFGLEATL